jgi:predicted nucleic acid-binding protein
VLYFDTSFLVPVVLPEATSNKLTSFVGELPPEQLAISHWTRVEFSSLVARDVRMGHLDRQAAAKADARFEVMVERSFFVILPNADDFDLARQYLGRFETGLRAGDAFHLAIAKNHRASMIYSLDKTLLKAGRVLALPMSRGPA